MNKSKNSTVTYVWSVSIQIVDSNIRFFRSFSYPLCSALVDIHFEIIVHLLGQLSSILLCGSMDGWYVRSISHTRTMSIRAFFFTHCWWCSPFFYASIYFRRKRTRDSYLVMNERNLSTYVSRRSTNVLVWWEEKIVFCVCSFLYEENKKSIFSFRFFSVLLKSHVVITNK